MRHIAASRALVIDDVNPCIGLDLCDKPCRDSRCDRTDTGDSDEHQPGYEAACGRDGEVMDETLGRRGSTRRDPRAMKLGESRP